MAWKGLEGIGGRRIGAGVWRWVAYHPEWEEDVACAALDGLEARGEPPAIVLTVFYHERSAVDILERIPGTALWAEESGVDRVESEVTHPFAAGDALPGGLMA